MPKKLPRGRSESNGGQEKDWPRWKRMEEALGRVQDLSDRKGS